MLVSAPGILNLLDEVEDGVGSVPTRAATEVGRREEVVLFGEHSQFPCHEGLDDLAKRVFQCNRAVGLGYAVVGFSWLSQRDSFEVLPHGRMVS